MVNSTRVPILDSGYCQYIEHYGSDERIIEAARMSTGKGFLGWEPGICPTCNGSGYTEPYPRVNCNDCEGKGKIAGDINLLRRLWVKKHATPFEMAGMIVEVAAPIMVFREWVRHRTQSFNEMSGRYVALPDTNYIPSLERVMINAGTKNKQAGTIDGAEVLTEENAQIWRALLEKHYHIQQELYQWALDHGIPKELARVHLAVGRYSRMRAAANLRNWLAFLTLRMAPDAQMEIRLYANQVGKLISEAFPRTWSLFMEGKA